MELLSIKEAARRLNVARSTFWLLTKEPGFPKPIQLTLRRKLYLDHEIEAWIAERIVERDAAIGGNSAASDKIEANPGLRETTLRKASDRNSIRSINRRKPD